jgi:hypothetical protein
VTRAILLGEDTSKFCEGFGDGRLLRSTQAKIAQDGPGMPIIYRAAYGFERLSHCHPLSLTADGAG